MFQKSFRLSMMYVQNGMFNDCVVDFWMNGGDAKIKG
jgi:hypothetical protein